MKRFLPIALASALAMVGFSIWPPMILANPASARAMSREAFLEDPVAPAVVPKGYDITIVEYADYNCPYCRRMAPVIAALLASDHKIRFIYRDWPLFGTASVEAARDAIASQWQGKHAAFNAALYDGSGKLDSAAIKVAAERADVNWARLQANLVRHKTAIDGLLARTNAQAEALGLQGTPGFFIGPGLLAGAVDLATMRQAIAEARAHPESRPTVP